MPAELPRQVMLTWPSAHHLPSVELRDCKTTVTGSFAPSTCVPTLVWLSPDLQEVQSRVALSVDSHQDRQGLAHCQEQQRM